MSFQQQIIAAIKEIGSLPKTLAAMLADKLDKASFRSYLNNKFL